MSDTPSRTRIRHTTQLARVTLAQISAACGLPLMTVSRALRGRTKEVNATDLALAVETARRLGYRPNLMNHALRTGRRQLFGVVCPQPDTYLHALLSGIHDVCLESEALICLHVLPVATDATGLATSLTTTLDRQVDGVVLIAPPGQPTGFAALPAALTNRVPMVHVDAAGLATGAAQVGLDLTLAAGSLVERLAQRRVRTLLLLASPRTPPRYQALIPDLEQAGRALGLTVEIRTQAASTPPILSRWLAAAGSQAAIICSDPEDLPPLLQFRQSRPRNAATFVIAGIAADEELLPGFHPDELLLTNPFAHGRAVGDLLTGMAYRSADARKILISPALRPMP
jgi:LacI family transcriptional regulator, repressor for deo operon, udp, cdd, tsx, nupC, and nupG